MSVAARRKQQYEEALAAASRFIAQSRYYDHQYHRDVIKIMPGEFHVASGSKIALATVLGSCVSAVIWDPVTRIGGMNHFMLSSSHYDGAHRESARFGLFAMDILIEHLVLSGALRNSLEAKVFGGARVLKGQIASDIGAGNAAFVLDYLEDVGIPVTAQSLGDVYARKLYFFSDTGQVLMRKVKAEDNLQVMREEQAFRYRLTREV